jgi:hypothetical protein
VPCTTGSHSSPGTPPGYRASSWRCTAPTSQRGHSPQRARDCTTRSVTCSAAGSTCRTRRPTPLCCHMFSPLTRRTPPTPRPGWPPRSAARRRWRVWRSCAGRSAHHAPCAMSVSRRLDRWCIRSRPDGQRAIQPPSTARTWPFTYAAAGEARNTTTLPMSCGFPQRPAGIRVESCSMRRGSDSSAVFMSVAM